MTVTFDTLGRRRSDTDVNQRVSFPAFEQYDSEAGIFFQSTTGFGVTGWR